MYDKLGKEFKVGDWVARATLLHKTPILEIERVTRIENGKLYLENRTQPIQCFDRLLIISSLEGF
jgi:hypothetical protein